MKPRPQEGRDDPRGARGAPTPAPGAGDRPPPRRALVLALALAPVLALAFAVGPALLCCRAAAPPGPRAPGAAQPPPGPATPPGPAPASQPVYPAYSPPAVPGRIEDPSGHALDSFYAALARAEARRADGRVAIVQLGDSHTAADTQTGRLRHRLQARFGDAGRGFLLPGRPIRHYYQRDAEYGSEGPWIVEDGRRRDAREPFGLAGVRIHSDSRDALAWVSSCPTCRAGTRVSRFEIVYRLRPDGGRLAYRLDGQRWHTLPTRAAAAADAGPPGSASTGFRVLRVRDGDHRLTLRPAGDGPVDLFGVALERDAPGVIVDSIGVVGARAAHLYGWDWEPIAVQLGQRDPQLVILAFGTNETYQSDLDLAHLEDTFVTLAARIREAAPGASILVLGPPDRGKRERSDCDPPRRRRRRGHRRPPPPPPRRPGPPPPGCEWRTPPILPSIIEAERRAARRAGVAFFDTFAAMGGADRMDAWYHEDPPLAYKDRVHFTPRGYERAADLLLAALLPEYERWRVRTDLPPAPTPPAPPAPAPTAPAPRPPSRTP